jgi:hypothetical protein
MPGGDALEVLSPSHTNAQVAEFATHARVHGFAASTGSDYHGPGGKHARPRRPAAAARGRRAGVVALVTVACR